MARITSKLQVTIPKDIAQRYGLQPGDDIEWLPAGDAIRVVPRAHGATEPAVGRRLVLFDRATERQERRAPKAARLATSGRGWRREDLYRRGRPR